MNKAELRKSVISAVAFFTALFVAFMSGRSSSREPAVVAATCPAEPDDAWTYRRMETCSQICGPVSFEGEATRDSIRCTCGRPDRIPRLRIIPGQDVTKIAQAPPKEGVLGGEAR